MLTKDKEIISFNFPATLQKTPKSKALIIIILTVLLGFFGSTTLVGATTWDTQAHVFRSIINSVATTKPTPTPSPTSSPTPSPSPTPTQPPPVSPFPEGFQQEVASLQAHDRILWGGNTQLPEIALTFDDGPNPYYTPGVLGVLKKYHIHATFFDVGNLITRYPDLVKREYNDGHLVGDHSWSHAELPLLSTADIYKQLASTSDAIQKVIGVHPSFFRPPYGAYNANVLTQANKFGFTVVLWNDVPADWARPGTDAIIYRTLAQAKNGSIILLHDAGGDRSQTIAALPTIIETLESRGYQFVTLQQLVDDLHGKKQVPPSPTPTPLPHAKGKGPLSNLPTQLSIAARRNTSL